MERITKKKYPGQLFLYLHLTLKLESKTNFLTYFKCLRQSVIIIRSATLNGPCLDEDVYSGTVVLL